MKIVISLFALAGIALLVFVISPGPDDNPGALSTEITSVTGDARTTETSDESAVSPSYTATPPGDDLSEQPENHVETFLTTTELNALHTQLLERLSNTQQPHIDESLSISSLGLERAQQYQLYLEPEDEIIRINSTPVTDLANNPAVGSLLAGPAIKLSVQRGVRVFEIDIRTYQ